MKEARCLKAPEGSISVLLLSYQHCQACYSQCYCNYSILFYILLQPWERVSWQNVLLCSQNTRIIFSPPLRHQKVVHELLYLFNFQTSNWHSKSCYLPWNHSVSFFHSCASQNDGLLIASFSFTWLSSIFTIPNILLLVPSRALFLCWCGPHASSLTESLIIDCKSWGEVKEREKARCEMNCKLPWPNAIPCMHVDLFVNHTFSGVR